MCTYSDESATWPQASPVADFNSWQAPANAQLGRYEIRIQYFSVEVGEMWEAEGAVTFYVCQATGSLKLSKWHDLNANGVRDHGEPGIPMWKLSFTDPFGSTFNRLTDANGNAVEDTLPIGHYDVWETVKPGWTNSTPVAATVGVLTGKETKVSFGNYQTGSIGDYVWLDSNRDGVQDDDEFGIPDVTLTLWLDSNDDGNYDTQVSTEITDENGWYLFDELPPGKYLVEVDEGTLPAGAHVLTTDNEPFPYELAPEEDMLEADFGYFKCTVEKCNGIDDDCDGDTDEGYPVDEACDGDDADKCKNGTWTCGDDGWSLECLNETETDIADICNGLDDDCDGETDEDFPLGDACDGDDGDQCETGTLTCAADGLGVECVNETDPDIKELCDGADNDCDGETDEDFTLLGQACDGTDSDFCTNGTFECHPPSICRTPNGCNEPVYECVNDFPTNIVEVCDGADNDCDGSIDEDLGSSTCGVGACVVTTANCIGGRPQICEPGAPVDEVCDLADNDCDGSVDEDLGTSSCGIGACAASVEYCIDGQVQNCVPGDAGVEICDFADNDCDGSIDEDLGTTTCGVGSCEITVDNCVNGVVPSCVPGDSHAEVCDLMDNDCDGSVDEELGSTSCGVGSCEASVENCINGEVQSCVPGTPAEEVCDLVDNDCDGAVDEDLGTTTCGVGSCEATVDNCVAGEVQSCAPGVPAEEVCDFADNDCDGTVDEGLGTTTCGVGACELTIDTCDDGELQICNPGEPGTEVCDLIDNDCDGAVDEDLGSTTCGVGACEATVDNCVAGAVQSCVPGDPAGETCDLSDNDCDGSVDEELGSTSCGVGACEASVENCVNGEIQSCVSGDPAAEVCDLADNDCDGAVDEDLGTTTCGIGACEATVDNCVAGEVPSCVPGNPVEESCDLADNDCDGAVDEDLGTTTCGQGVCMAATENCIDGQVQSCVPGDSFAETCDGLDNNCDGEVDDSLGTTTCGVGACKTTVDNCLDGQNQSCQPGAPGEEICGNLVDEDCDGMLNEGCDSGDDCELPDGCIGLAEAFARGWILIDVSGSANTSVDIHNFGTAPVCFNEFLLFLSDPTQSLSTDVDTADGQTMEVAPGEKVTLQYGPWTFANGSYEPQLNQPPWWCVEDGQVVTEGADFVFFGEATPTAFVALIDGETDLDNDGKEDHVDWAGSLGTQTVYNIWAYQGSHSVLTVGKVAVATDPGTVGVVLTSHNMGALQGLGVLADTLPAGFSAGNFSVEPDSTVVNPDGSTTLLWDIELAGYEDMPGDDGSTVFDAIEITYDLFPALDANGARLELPKAAVTYNDGDAEQVNESASVFAVNVDVDGDGYPACEDCIDSDPESFPGAEERCDGLDNDCDDDVDEDFGDLGDVCNAGIGECNSDGEMACAADGLGTECNAVPGEPVDEVCDLLDNDCDELVDEELGSTTCGVGACVASVENCVAGEVQTCVPGDPTDELCDLIDNDCDGDLDEELGTTTCGVGECEVTVDNCGDGSADLVAFAAGLPAQVQKIIAHPGTGFGAPSYYDVTILGQSILAGTFDAYCVDTDTFINPGATYTANVYSSYDVIPDGIMEFPENLDLVNYIINQGYVGTPSQDGSLFTYGDVQRAIWTLIDDGLVTNGLGPWTQARVDEILADALADGEGFEPDCDQYVGVILQPLTNNQLTIAQVSMALVPGSCDPNQECVPGDPTEEICDGLDNDCDGEIDEDLGSTSCGLGECANTVENCVDGQAQECDPFLGADDETCDLLDNDCDGEIDDDLGTSTCGVGECEVTIDNCGDGSADLAVFAAGLPAQVQKILAHPGTGFGVPSYYDVTILGQSILAGTFDAYCVDTDTFINPGATYTANVYSSYDVIPDGIMEFPENLDLVNYIINQGYVGTPSQDGSLFTYGDVQRAIWTLIDDGLVTNGLGPWTQARVDEILADALADGEGFEPDCDQYVGVILQPLTNNQLTIAQVSMALVPGSCDPNQECVPGDPTEEICDGLDNDCDGEIDEDLGTTSCGVGACAATVDSCLDGEVQSCVPGNPTDESCDLVDNDCDGSVDEDLGTTTCGVGECENTVDYCVAGEVQSCVPGDAATEICDALDNDCDGSIDEGFQLGESCSIGGCGGENLEVWAVSDDNDPLIVATADAVLTGSTLACNFEHNYDGMAEYKEFFVDTVLTINDDFAPSLLYAYGSYDGGDWTGMDDTLEDMVADGDVGAYDMWDVSAGTPLDLLPGDLDGVDVVILDAAPDTAANHFVVTEASKQVLRDFQDDGGKLIVSAYIFVYWKDYVGSEYELQNADLADLVGNVLPDITQDAWATATTLEPSPHGAGETLVTLIGAEPWRKKPADPFFHEFWVLDASPVVSGCYSEGEYVCADDGSAECNAEVLLPGDELCGDEIDNDCDCEADEGFDNLGNACDAGVGACYAEGEIVCSADGLSEACDAVAGDPVDETCDGVDNDCDGSVDENMGTATCGVGTCQVTVENCIDGTPQECQAAAPTDEVCDGADNDCDGSVDEDLGNTTCGVGACAASVEYCVNGQVQECVSGAPTSEECDLVDNDCDGSVDEDLGVTTCGQGVCQVTVENCVAGELQSCVAATPSCEVCDGIDNDCDGLVDEGLGTSTCGAGACKATVQNCVNSKWQVCEAGTPGTEVCDGIDNDCDSAVDEGLGTLSCGEGACENTVQACVNGQAQQCTPGTPVAEVCDDVTDNDCDGSIDEGCDSNDDCELPDECVTLAEAFARDWIAIDTPSFQSSTVTIHNLGPVEVCLDEHLLFISDPTQSMTNGTEKANGKKMKIKAGGKINLRYAPWTFPNGYYQPYLNQPPWWCVEYGQLSTKNTLFGYYGEQAPEMVQYYIDNKTDTDGDGKEDHVDWGGKYGTKTLYNIWGYQNSHGMLTAGKVAGAAGPGDIAVALTSHNLGAFSAQGVLVDTIPAGYWVDNFSLDPDGWVENNDGTVTIYWNIDLEGYEDKSGWNTTTVFDLIEITYDLHADWDEEGKRIELPRASITFSDGEQERTSNSALVIAINVDVDGDGYGGCQDCDNGDQDVYPGADEVCDGVDNDCDGNTDEGCPVCGNGVIEDGEICDDGDDNEDVMYACQTDCTLSIMWPTSGQTTIAYEDLPLYGGNDWDYNDWIIELEVEYIFSADGVKQMRLYADPWARGAAYHHSQGIAIAMGTYASTGTYQVKHYNTAWQKTGEEDEVSFGTDEDIAITMFADTWETLPPNSINGDAGVWSFDANTEIGYGTVLAPKVGVEFHFDTALALEPAQLLNTAPGTHCEGMPYDLYLLVNNTGEYIANGDTRMLCVPDYWDWPSEKQSIWNVYDGITPAAGGPIFDDGWYLADPIGSTWYAG